jgi:hypothetical protein
MRLIFALANYLSAYAKINSDWREMLLLPPLRDANRVGIFDAARMLISGLSRNISMPAGHYAAYLEGFDVTSMAAVDRFRKHL